MVLTRISIAFLLLTAVCGAQIVNPPSNPVKSVSVSYAAKPGDSIILYSGVMDGSQGITLPVVGISIGKIYTVKVISTDATGSALNINTGNTAEMAGNPQLYSIPTGVHIGGSIILVWDGYNYWALLYKQ